MIIYDCEIIKAIPSKHEAPMAGIEYCAGWHDFENMGISTICAYDYATERHRIFLKDNMHEFQQLVDETDVVVGFNSHRFDDLLPRANGVNVPQAKSYDLLTAIWAGAGLGPEFSPSTHGGFSLDACCKANFKVGKTGDGALAPILWQKGYPGKVIDYCMMDISLTKKLLETVVAFEEIVDPRSPAGTRFSVAPPTIMPGWMR